MTLEEKEKYLMLPSYKASDIQKMLGVKKSRAGRIKDICKYQYQGEIKGRPNHITARSFWKYMGTTVEEELRLLGVARGYDKKE